MLCPFLPLDVLVSIADCPVRLCFCVTVLFSFLFYPFFLLIFGIVFVFFFVLFCFFPKHIILNFFKLCFLGSSQGFIKFSHFPILRGGNPGAARGVS